MSVTPVTHNNVIALCITCQFFYSKSTVRLSKIYHHTRIDQFSNNAIHTIVPLEYLSCCHSTLLVYLNTSDLLITNFHHLYLNNELWMLFDWVDIENFFVFVFCVFLFYFLFFIFFWFIEARKLMYNFLGLVSFLFI